MHYFQYYYTLKHHRRNHLKTCGQCLFGLARYIVWYWEEKSFSKLNYVYTDYLESPCQLRTPRSSSMFVLFMWLQACMVYLDIEFLCVSWRSTWIKSHVLALGFTYTTLLQINRACLPHWFLENAQHLSQRLWMHQHDNLTDSTGWLNHEDTPCFKKCVYFYSLIDW